MSAAALRPALPDTPALSTADKANCNAQASCAGDGPGLHAIKRSQPEVSPEALEMLTWAVQICRADTQPGPAASGHSVMPIRPKPAEWRTLPLTVLRPALDEILLSRHSREGLDALQQSGALDVWLPEIAATVGFGEADWRHKDVWQHTKQVVWQSVPRLALRWGALLHDIGKTKTRRVDARGEVTFHGHAEVGAAMFRRRIAARLGFSGALKERIHFLIYHHLRGSQYDGSWTDSAVRRFYRDMGDGLDDLLLLSRADITTKRRDKRRRALRWISELDRRVAQLKQADSRVAPLPKGMG
ncbi:MAG: HDIG domain-containing metalloprotein, partial [Polyangiales bacterium]